MNQHLSRAQPEKEQIVLQSKDQLALLVQQSRDQEAHPLKSAKVSLRKHRFLALLIKLKNCQQTDERVRLNKQVKTFKVIKCIEK